jgi:hypothetical protein
MKPNELKNVQNFMQSKELIFKDSKVMISWVKRHLKLKTIIKIGSTYLAEQIELEKTFSVSIKNQARIYQKRLKQVEVLRDKKNQKIKNKQKL